MTTTLSTLTIRRFREEDYAAYTALHNDVYTDFSKPEDGLRFIDNRREEPCKHARWIAERNGRVVGYSQYDQYRYVYHPQKFELEVAVDPACLQVGIGTALFRALIDALRQYDPIQVGAWGREDMPCRVRFLANRGFEENFRVWTSELDLRRFDPTPYAEHTRLVAEQGVRIATLEALGGHTAENLRQLFDAHLEWRDDLPLPPGEERQSPSYEEWLKGIDNPTYLPDGYYVAVADGQFVGVSNMWRSPEPDMVRTGLTAVRREYRRRGIALALKVAAIGWAKSAGYARTLTDNASVNRPMLAINEQLGFVRKPAWIHYVADWAAASR